MHRGTFLKPLRRTPGRSKNFLRDGAQYRVAHRGKGLLCFATASFNAISKNAGIGDRSGDLVVRSRNKSPYCKYSIFVRELDNSGGKRHEVPNKYTIFTVVTFFPISNHEPPDRSPIPAFLK